MLTKPTWAEIAQKYPEASVMWDIQGGGDWTGNRSGPRFYLHDGGVKAAVGELTNGNWDQAYYSPISNLWHFGTDECNKILFPLEDFTRR